MTNVTVWIINWTKMGGHMRASGLRSGRHQVEGRHHGGERESGSSSGFKQLFCTGPLVKANQQPVLLPLWTHPETQNNRDTWCPGGTLHPHEGVMTWVSH